MYEGTFLPYFTTRRQDREREREKESEATEEEEGGKSSRSRRRLSYTYSCTNEISIFIVSPVHMHTRASVCACVFVGPLQQTFRIYVCLCNCHVPRKFEKLFEGKCEFKWIEDVDRFSLHTSSILYCSFNELFILYGVLHEEILQLQIIIRNIVNKRNYFSQSEYQILLVCSK